MALILLCSLAVVLALGLVQAWTIWYLRREVARLEFRLGEALDDEDLLEFQDRLKTLLSEAKAASAHLAKTADSRRQELEQALDKVRHAEKSLALRLVASAADAQKPSARPKGAKAAGARRAAKAPAPEARREEAVDVVAPAKDAQGLSSREKSAPREGAAPREKPQAKPVSSGDQRRSYLVRPKDQARSKHQNIYDLADQGLDVEAIARQSGLLAGEVDLILSLRRRPEA